MRLHTRQSGFSLIEIMVVLFIFLIVTGAVFGLLSVAQVRYRAEQQFLDSLQGARLGIEQLTRDIHRAGFPPRSAYDDIIPTNPAAAWVTAGGVPVTSVAVPFLGMVGNNVDQTCTVNGGANPCTIPNPFELVIETDLDPENTVTPEQVEWVYYRLDTPGNGVVSPPTGGGASRTLYRRVVPKTCAGPPFVLVPMTCVTSGPGTVTAPVGLGTPMVDNVVQDPGVAVGPANPAVFTYVCRDMDNDGAPDPTCTPENIEEIYMVLQARAISPDIQTGGVRALTLQSVARVLNPP